MDIVICPVCHISVSPSDYFCRNCGKNLHPRPLPSDFGHQMLIYIGSIFLFPMGFIWGIRYLREKNQTEKIVGYISMIISVAVLIFLIFATSNIINTVNKQVEQQMQMFGGI